jgi:hypothetical protein
LNSKFDIKNFQDVYVSEIGSKYGAESSILSDRKETGPVASLQTASDANIEASPVRPVDNAYLDSQALDSMKQRPKINELIQLESCSSLSSSMLDVTKNVNNN